MNEKRRLLGMTLDELKGVAFEAGLPGYAAKQWLTGCIKKKSDFYCSDDEYSLGETCLVGEKTLRWGPYLLPT